MLDKILTVIQLSRSTGIKSSVDETKACKAALILVASKRHSKKNSKNPPQSYISSVVIVEKINSNKGIPTIKGDGVSSTT